MIKRYGLMLCTALAGATLLVGLATAADKVAETTPITPGLQTVQGDVLKIEGDSYVVKDMTGKEIRLHVDKTTKLEGSFKAGDKIEAQVTEKGHALSITKPLVADAQIPGPQTVKGDLLKIEGEFYTVHGYGWPGNPSACRQDHEVGRYVQDRRQGRGPGHGKGPRIVH